MNGHDMERAVRTIGDADQAAAWNGPEGASWAAQSARRPPDGDLVAAVLEAAAIGRHEQVLDIGCGTGELTRRAARAASEGSALGVDLSALMVAVAREQAGAARLGNVRFDAGDVQAYPFEAASFDVALSHFGVMFFAEPVAAFADVAAALRPGGRLVFACPGEMSRCDWYGVPLAALYGHRPTPDEAPSAMFSLSDPAVVQRLLADAGFAEVRVSPLGGTFWFGADAPAAAETFLGTGPVRAFLERHPSVAADEALAALSEVLAAHVGPDGVRLPGAHWLVEAKAPALRSARAAAAP